MRHKPIAITALTAALICLLVYLRALSCGFVNVDDPDYVLSNPMIRHLDGELLSGAFTGSYLGWWMPLTWISFALDYRFWGVNPLGYHLTNIVLHAINTGLVVLIADRLCRGRFGGGAFPESRWQYPGLLILAGLLFGIHPLRVESVAWVTERKDVLNGLFSLGAVLLYLDFVRKKEQGGAGALGRYLLSLALFSLSLMAKSVSVVIPAMLLVADWYPLERLKPGRFVPVLLGKLPFFLLSGAMSVVTIRLTAGHAQLVPYDVFPFQQRLVVSGNAVFEYCRLLLFPVGIRPFYEIPPVLPASFAVKGVAVLVVTGGALAVWRRRPWLAATWLLFLLPLLPVLAFFQNGEQAMAARFTYLPSVAPSIAAAALAGAAWRHRAHNARFIAAALAVTFLLFCGGTTLKLIGVWQDTGTLWSRVIELHPLGRAYSDRAFHYRTVGDHSAAIDDFSQAIRIAVDAAMPEIYNLYAFRGLTYAEAGQYDKAVADFSAAIALYPHPTYYYQRGLALREMGRAREAEADIARAGSGAGPIDWYFSKEQPLGKKP
jgi:protein O-mannosyl-transferase